MDMHTGRTPCEHEGRDWNNTSTAKQGQKLLATPQKFGEGIKQIALHSSQKESLCQHRGLRFLPPTTVRQQVFVVSVHGICKGSSGKLIKQSIYFSPLDLQTGG